jgi:hypothetical protein
VHDVARFRPDDPAELVAASFACPLCLHAPVAVRLPGAFDEPAAACMCGSCATGWDVALDAMQLLRLTLSPPPGLATPPMWGVGSG